MIMIRKTRMEVCRIRIEGVPVRLAMGGRDLENATIEVAVRYPDQRNSFR